MTVYETEDVNRDGGLQPKDVTRAADVSQRTSHGRQTSAEGRHTGGRRQPMDVTRAADVSQTRFTGRGSEDQPWPGARQRKTYIRSAVSRI